MEKEIINRWSFGWNKTLADHLISLVFSWIKTATTGLYFNNEIIWKVGDYAIIYDEESWKDLCVIEYTKITIKSFIDVDFEYIQREGEWDKDIESWRDSHREFYTREYPWKLHDNSLVVCEEFKLIKKL